MASIIVSVQLTYDQRKGHSKHERKEFTRALRGFTDVTKRRDVKQRNSHEKNMAKLSACRSDNCSAPQFKKEKACTDYKGKSK